MQCDVSLFKNGIQVSVFIVKARKLGLRKYRVFGYLNLHLGDCAVLSACFPLGLRWSRPSLEVAMLPLPSDLG